MKDKSVHEVKKVPHKSAFRKSLLQQKAERDKNSDRYWRRKAILGILTFIAVYFLMTPLMPIFDYYIAHQFDETKGYAYDSRLAREFSNADIDASKLKPIPPENTLVIPKIGVDAKIHEGQEEHTLLQGIWRRPNTSTPDKGGNTVLTAHRFMYMSGPNTFFSLDKVKEGDTFAVFWQGQEYTYQVYQIEVVGPERVEIENPTEDPIITLYTCTPLWTSDKRLVVQAKKV
ncbi:MAG: sortase [Candidatus Dojkabacteria bacterium]